jgi:Tol biopolymer transport system component
MGYGTVTEGEASGTGTGEYAACDWGPAWSPDGLSIAFTRGLASRAAPLPNGNGTTRVSLQELMVWHDGSTPTETMLTDAYTALGEVDWSPDGSTLVFTGAPTLFYENETDGLAWPRVLLIPSDGGDVTPISPDEQAWAAGATWSPDGEWIAYVDNNHSLVVMRPDGTERRTLSIDPGRDEIIGPSWGVAPSA